MYLYIICILYMYSSIIVQQHIHISYVFYVIELEIGKDIIGKLF